MAKAKGLTYEEFINLAQQNYSNGGDVVMECWGKKEFGEYEKMFGPVTKAKALKMFRQYKSEECEQDAMARW